MSVKTLAPPFPLMDEDWEWFAFDRSWTPRQVVSELVHNLIDWYLDDHTWYDDDDRLHGWIGAYRELFEAVVDGHIRPFDASLDHNGDDGWWFQCDADHPEAVPAWIVVLE